MSTFHRFEDIDGWQVARELNRRVWEWLSSGCFGKDFGLSDQLNRAAGSAMDNIAEGFDSGSDAEFVRFLRYAQRSCGEVKSQLYRALDRGHVDQAQFDAGYELADHAARKIGALIRFLSQ